MRVRLTHRERGKQASRAKMLSTAAGMFASLPYVEVGIREIAAACALTTGAVYGRFDSKETLYRHAMGLPHPWRPVQFAPKDGRLCLLLVDGTGGEGKPLEDAKYWRTVGSNNFDNDGEDVWKFAGWCWSHDHHVDGDGTPIGYVLLDDAAPAITERDRFAEFDDAGRACRAPKAVQA